jgi:hypothetical protein
MGEAESQAVLDSYSDVLRAIGSAVLPDPYALDDEGWAEAERIIEGALAPKPPGIKRQIRLFLRVANLFSVFRTGRTLTKLRPHRRLAFLEKLQRSRLMTLRRGMWGIRTLIFMGYYLQDRVRAEIGYSATPWGWTAYHQGRLEKKRVEAEDPAVGEGPGDASEGKAGQ